MQRPDAASPADRHDTDGGRREWDAPGSHHLVPAAPAVPPPVSSSGLSRLLLESPASRTDPSPTVNAAAAAASILTTANTTTATATTTTTVMGGDGAVAGDDDETTTATRAGRRTLLDSSAVGPAAAPSVGICPCRTPVLLDMSRCAQTDLDLLDWLDKCVLLVRSVPGLAPLPAADRALLLAAAWKELVILYMAQGRFDFDYLVPAGGLDELARKLSGPGSIPTRHGQCCIHWSWIEGIPTLRSVEQLRFILHKFGEIRPDDKEFALLRVLLLFNADLRGLSNSPAVEAANERVHTALMEYENACYPRDPLRLSHLLLLLPGVRGFSTKVFENLFYKHLTRDMNVEGLLGQMLRG